MAILNNSNAISSGGYDINNSLRFRSSASAYLNRTPASAGNRQIWTISVWVKRGTLGVDQKICSAYGADSDSGLFDLRFTAGNVLYFGYWTSAQETAAVYRDPSAWYHIVVAVDTTQATAGNRVKMYINGTQVTVSGAAFAQNTNLAWNNNVTQNIGRQARTSDGYFDGYLAEFNSIDGQALTPSSFGETDTTTGSWKPKAYTSTYGTNGFYLKFSDIATTSGSNAGLGKDFSGNANYWTTNNISVTAGTTYDAMIDSPTLTSATVANYAVLNPVYKSSSQPTISNGNLTVAPSAATYQNAFSSIGVTSGKWYCEVVVTGTPNSANLIGVSNTTQLNYLTSTTSYIGNSTGVGYGYFLFNGQKYSNDIGTSYGNTIASGDIVGIALDLDNGKIWFSKNGTWQASGDPAAGTNAAFTGIASDTWSIGSTVYSGGATSFNFNFGQRPFSYTPPTGFVALNTYNLPDSTIKKGNTVMDATTYTGDGATTRSITNAASFKPDLIWIKGRSNTGSHTLQDSNRGFGTATKLSTNSTNAENNASADATDPIYGYVTAANSNGFTVNNGTTPTQTNQNGTTYVGWQWQAGQGSTSSNTSGSITSTISVNTTAGFSVVTYTGTGANATVGHGLGVAPKMVIVKNRTTSGDEWCVWHTSLTNATYYLYLNATSAQAVDTTFWNSTAPSSTVISLGSNGRTNRSSSNMVCYAWAEISGFSKFGSYTGNGSTDGPFVYTGFRPKYLLTKPSSTTGSWTCYDTSRDTYNVADRRIEVNDFAAEYNNGNGLIDFLSNGFKPRVNHPSNNSSGVTYIYMAFAENPFKNALAR